jgi:hypothetical protein
MPEPPEDMPQEPAETPQPPAHIQPAKKHRLRGIIAWIAGLTGLVMLLALLFSVFISAFTHRAATVSGGKPPPAGWQRYTDPGGHFTISIPKGWTVQTETSTGEEGSSHGNVTFHDTMDAFGGPPEGQNTITVWIYAQPIESDPARQVMCDFGFYKHSNTTLAGLPAWYNGNATWIVESSGAHFQISYAYPNDKGDEFMPPDEPTATPMPPAFYEQGQQELHTLLASFMPTPDTPLQCP